MTVQRSIIFKTQLAVVLVTALMAIGVAGAQATYNPGGMKKQSFCVQNPNVNTTWLNAINNGRNAWNNHSQFPGNLTVYSACTSVLKVGNYGDEWFGLYTPLITGLQYEIKLDSKNINSHVAEKGYAFANVTKSTTAHEFGHALRLGHAYSMPTSLMDTNRNRNNVTGPNTGDVLESNSYY